MSFLVSPGDPETLAEALAFVDGFDFSDNKTNDASEGSDSAAEIAVESHKRHRSDDHDAVALDKHEKAKTRRRNAVYAARLRAKKKNEMQQLKEEMAQLQMRLDRLKALPSTALTDSWNENDRILTTASSSTGSSYWLQEATAQSYRRQQAEQLNAQLKTLLTKVVKRSKSMQDAFQHLQSLGCEINVAVGAPSTIVAGTSLRGNDATPQLKYLRNYLDQMYATAQDVLTNCEPGAVESASFVSQIKRDPVSGRKIVHLSSSTPVANDLDNVSRMIWQGMQFKDNLCCTYYVHRMHVNASSVAKSFFLTLNDDPTPCTLHGAAFVRKFEERDRILYIWTTAIVPSKTQEFQDRNLDSDTYKLRIREKGWAMLSRSPSNPEHGSIFRTCYEVSSELGEMGQEYDSAEIDYDRIGHGVVNLLSNDLRKFHEHVQDNLLADTSLGVVY